MRGKAQQQAHAACIAAAHSFDANQEWESSY
jgi:hypothetical protein